MLPSFLSILLNLSNCLPCPCFFCLPKWECMQSKPMKWHSKIGILLFPSTNEFNSFLRANSKPQSSTVKYHSQSSKTCQLTEMQVYKIIPSCHFVLITFILNIPYEPPSTCHHIADEELEEVQESFNHHGVNCQIPQPLSSHHHYNHQGTIN